LLKIDLTFTNQNPKIMITADSIETHHEYKTWLNKLEFFKDELKIFKNRLSEVTKQNTNHDVLAMVEHFQNQIIIQRNEIDTLRHNIKQYENSLEAKVKENIVAANHNADPEFDQHKESITTFEYLFNELRDDCVKFFSKVM